MVSWGEEEIERESYKGGKRQRDRERKVTRVKNKDATKYMEICKHVDVNK